MLPRKTAVSLILIAAFLTFPLAPAVAQQPYVLGPEDVIEVLVLGNPEVSRTVTIRPDGMISLPLIGEVAAAGLAPEQLRQRLTELFARYFRSPQVSVIVREFRRVRVSVLGQVSRPGIYELKQSATVLDALAAAGGLAPEAGLGEARLIRARDAPVVIDLERLLLQGEMAFNHRLENGDTLVVPEDSSTRVYVLGEVARAGVFPLRGPLTALQALTLAGGPTRRALLNRAHVIRREGQPVVGTTVTLVTVVVSKQSTADLRIIPVDLHKVIREGDVSRDLSLRRGDVLYIPENPLALENIALLLGIVADALIVLR